jgi:hypothetical protein
MLIASRSVNVCPPLFSGLYMTIRKQIFVAIEGYSLAVSLSQGKPVAHYRYSVVHSVLKRLKTFSLLNLGSIQSLALHVIK